MLVSLTIQDVVLIESLTLDFSKGFTVFTGETGAGKSILLDALSLGLGARGDTDLIRKGTTQANVSALFEVSQSHPVWALVEEHGLNQEKEASTLVLRRILSQEGKSRAFINDSPVSITLLKKVGETLVEIHGQFDRLLESTDHTLLLDAFGEHLTLTKEVQKAFKEWKEASQSLAQALEEGRKEKAEEELLQHYVQELEAFCPQQGEEEALLQKRFLLQSQDKIEKTLQNTLETLETRGGFSVEESLRTSLKTLGRLESEETKSLIQPILETLEKAFSEYQEAYHLLQAAAQSFSKERDSLENIEERLHALRSLARKHQVMPDALEEIYRSLKNRLFSLEKLEVQLEELEKDVTIKGQAYLNLAIELSQRRKKAALLLAEAVQKEFPDLKLERTKLKVDYISVNKDENGLPKEGGNLGLEKILFLIDTNGTSHFGLLKDVASGGELARILLALKVILAKAQGTQTLVFDEIDTGVSGAVSAAIGKRLQKLGESIQVLAITHSPQVASSGSSHFRIQKTFLEEKTPKTEAIPLLPQERTEEIARLISGEEITHEARAVAQRLIGQ